MRFVPAVYRIGLFAYPPAFRRRYRGEMSRVFEEGLRDARSVGGGGIVGYCADAAGDLLAGAIRERLAAMDPVSAGSSLLAVLAGAGATYVDLHASEVQATLLVLVVANCVLGCVAPKGAWRRAILAAVLLPAIHVVKYAAGTHFPIHGHPYVSRLMIFWPAFGASVLGAYAGVLLRLIGRGLADSARGGNSDSGAVT